MNIYTSATLRFQRELGANCVPENFFGSERNMDECGPYKQANSKRKGGRKRSIPIGTRLCRQRGHTWKIRIYRRDGTLNCGHFSNKKADPKLVSTKDATKKNKSHLFAKHNNAR